MRVLVQFILPKQQECPNFDQKRGVDGGIPALAVCGGGFCDFNE